MIPPQPAPADWRVDPDITRAETLPGAFYHDPRVHAVLLARLARHWQWLGDLADVAQPSSLSPRELLPGSAAEPLLLARDAAGTLRCLSNVCTHRGNLLVTAPCQAAQIRCGYHSRRFDLTGRMTFMPEFRDACDFPRAADHLPVVPFAAWRGHGFAALDPVIDFEEAFRPIAARSAWLPLESARHDPAEDRDYVIEANWALYVENYLEGFHIPFVHAGLNAVVDYGSYRSELFDHCNLQLALAREGEDAFDPPPGSPDHGQRVAAYYWWLFPNLMLNFYPWGLSVNRVLPEGIARTRVQFRSYVWDVGRRAAGAGAALHQVEMEDEAIVRQVQRGTRAAAYGRGRYSPTRERGTHHFHRLLCEVLQGGADARSPGALMEDAER